MVLLTWDIHLVSCMWDNHHQYVPNTLHSEPEELLPLFCFTAAQALRL